MSDSFIAYMESNLVCLLIFIIFLLRDFLGKDRQEKQIKFDHALMALMMYFISDTFWFAVVDGELAFSFFSVAATNLVNYLVMAAVTYTWLNFVMAYENVEHRDRSLNKFAVLFPFLVSTVALLILLLVAPATLIDEDNNVTVLFNVFLVAVPDINIVAVLFYTLRKAKNEPNRESRRDHIAIGLFPLIVLAGGIVQIAILPRTPIFCFCCTLLMLIMYIQSMEKKISIDPLTGLNNRGQMARYISQEQNLRKEKSKTYVMMIDVNDFKVINDTYGHAQGDRALILLAESLRHATTTSEIPSFLCRYGGDEFLLIVHANEEEDVKKFIEEIRDAIQTECQKANAPFTLSVGIGYDEYLGGQDTIQSCMQRADYKLYLDKEYNKLNSRSERE